MDIELRTQTNDPRLALRGLTYVAGSGFSATLELWSSGFGAARQLWFSRFDLGRFLERLRAMDATLTGTAELGAEHEPDHFALSVDRSGHVLVRGELFEFGCDQRLVFCFTTDQTCLAPFIRELSVCYELQAV